MKDNIFLIVISGVFIFVLQKIISDMWIAPHIEFQRFLVKIEVLMIKAHSIYKCTYRKNNLVSSTGTTLDEDIENTRRKINLNTWKLLGYYNSLFFLDKLWLKFRGINMYKVKPALLSLSAILCSEKDCAKEKSEAKSNIDEIYSYLKFNRNFLG